MIRRLQILFLTLNASAFVTPAYGQFNMSFQYYQLYRDASDFDSSALWNKAKLKKTFENKGAVYYNNTKKSIRFKLKDTDVDESYNLFMESKNYAYCINGWRIYKFHDSNLGPSIAVYQFPKKIWVIYRQNKPPKKKASSTGP